MSYFSAEEVNEVARKVRDGRFPCDVLHLDPGWFRTSWKCDWQFSPERFPDPEGFKRGLRQQGFRISLWQHPFIDKDISLYETAGKNKYIGMKGQGITPGSDFTDQDSLGRGTIDFTNSEAVRWYQGMLERVLRMGAAVIKTDFGEDIDMEADYAGMPAHLLHNLYALLYQKAAYEITKQTTGEGLVWARPGWIGCQRYPVHWGGDPACTWDGLAGTLRGGLHLGCSGFAFWSHDVPGFHSLPDFMNSRPANDLYVRGTQFGVFTSHMRYHGTFPREPYEYSAVADIVREWLNLRYALIPYLVDQGRKAIASGYPVLRALIFHHQDDPYCWQIDDQFYCGDALLVAPVANSEGVRNVYLPEGRWRDLWNGQIIEGPRMLKQVASPLERIPVYAVDGATIRVYPKVVQSTNEMDLTKAVPLTFDDSYRGLNDSVLGNVAKL